MSDIQPFTDVEARKRAKAAVENGLIAYSRPHAIDRMRQRNISAVDVENVLRGGYSGCCEYENGAWRYKVCSNKMTVVIELWDDGRVFVVTAFRQK